PSARKLRFRAGLGTALRAERARAEPAHSDLGFGGRLISTAATAALKRRHPLKFGLRLDRLRQL
ncbi:MAG: hypothetical protein ACXWZ1_03120, partial [Gaiellaceae bacterium]